MAPTSKEASYSRSGLVDLIDIKQRAPDEGGLTRLPSLAPTPDAMAQILPPSESPAR
jgi:hypothetical protein